MRSLVVVLMLLPLTAVAAPPTGYACAPGTANKGVGCTCPNGYTDKRDSEGTALCAAAATPNITAQVLALATKGDVDAAIKVAEKYTFKVDQKTFAALTKPFGDFTKTAVEQLTLLASRGQCQAMLAPLAKFDRWKMLFVTLLGKQLAGSDIKAEAIDALLETLDDKLEPVRALLQTCIATASKDDGTAAITAARDANATEIQKCFTADVPPLKTPLTVKVVVDADGKVATTTVTATWPDLDLKISNVNLEWYRLKLISEREACFIGAIQKWAFKPNARGFAATIPIPRK